MPLIQRNLFPRRPPSKKCNGPSVLQLSENDMNNRYKPKKTKNNSINEKSSIRKISNVETKSEAVIIAQRLPQKSASVPNFMESGESSNSDSRYVSKTCNFLVVVLSLVI